jgi:hypothetical protein
MRGRDLPNNLIPNIEQWKPIMTAAIRLLDDLRSALPLDGIDTALEDAPTRKSTLEVLTADEEQAKWLAVYLTFSIIPTLLESAYRLLAGELFYEAQIMIRSLAEALDLVDLFSRDECKPVRVMKWLEGDIIPNRDSRNDSTGFFWRGEELILGPDYINDPEARLLLAKLRAKPYHILSTYAHHTGVSIIQAKFHRDKSEFIASAFDAFNNELVRALSYFQTLFGAFLDGSSRKQMKATIRQVKQMFPSPS